VSEKRVKVVVFKLYINSDIVPSYVLSAFSKICTKAMEEKIFIGYETHTEEIPLKEAKKKFQKEEA